MKLSVHPKILPYFTLGAGGLGLALRVWFFAARDGKGLLPAVHFANTVSYLLLAATLAVLLLCVRQLPKGGKYRTLFPAGTVPAAGCAIGAVAIAYTAIADAVNRVSLSGVALVLGLAAAACLLLVAYFRFKGARPSVYVFAVPAIYLMFHALMQVRMWSKETQQFVIFFPLMASVFLMLSTYLHAQLAVRQEGLQGFVFCNQAALFLCCLSFNSDASLFYIGMAAWMGCDFCNLPKKVIRQEET